MLKLTHHNENPADAANMAHHFSCTADFGVEAVEKP